MFSVLSKFKNNRLAIGKGVESDMNRWWFLCNLLDLLSMNGFLTRASSTHSLSWDLLKFSMIDKINSWAIRAFGCVDHLPRISGQSELLPEMWGSLCPISAEATSSCSSVCWVKPLEIFSCVQSNGRRMDLSRESTSNASGGTNPSNTPRSFRCGLQISPWIVGKFRTSHSGIFILSQ